MTRLPCRCSRILFTARRGLDVQSRAVVPGVALSRGQIAKLYFCQTLCNVFGNLDQLSDETV